MFWKILLLVTAASAQLVPGTIGNKLILTPSGYAHVNQQALIIARAQKTSSFWNSSAFTNSFTHMALTIKDYTQTVTDGVDVIIHESGASAGNGLTTYSNNIDGSPVGYLTPSNGSTYTSGGQSCSIVYYGSWPNNINCSGGGAFACVTVSYGWPSATQTGGYSVSGSAPGSNFILVGVKHLHCDQHPTNPDLNASDLWDQRFQSITFVVDDSTQPPGGFPPPSQYQAGTVNTYNGTNSASSTAIPQTGSTTTAPSTQYANGAQPGYPNTAQAVPGSPTVTNFTQATTDLTGGIVLNPGEYVYVGEAPKSVAAGTSDDPSHITADSPLHVIVDNAPHVTVDNTSFTVSGTVSLGNGTVPDGTTFTPSTRTLTMAGVYADWVAHRSTIPIFGLVDSFALPSISSTALQSTYCTTLPVWGELCMHLDDFYFSDIIAVFRFAVIAGAFFAAYFVIYS